MTNRLMIWLGVVWFAMAFIFGFARAYGYDHGYHRGYIDGARTACAVAHPTCTVEVRP